MNDSKPSEVAIEAALAPGELPPVGRYRLDLTTGRWHWSDEIFAMHGFTPGEVVPTTELILSHKHPEDRDRVDHAFRQGSEDGQPFSSVHRILDAHKNVRTLAITGQARTDPQTGDVTEVFGYFIDVTEANRDAAQREATAAIEASAQHRSTIEQAKGVLMVGLGLDSDEAFNRLRVASNHLNVPLRHLATWLLEWFRRPGSTTFPTADQLDDFLTAPIPPSQTQLPDAPMPAAD